MTSKNNEASEKSKERVFEVSKGMGSDSSPGSQIDDINDDSSAELETTEPVVKIHESKTVSNLQCKTRS